jgi:hypothetical protein
MHTLLAFGLFLLFIVAFFFGRFLVKRLFFAPPDTSEDWIKDEKSSFNTPYPTVSGQELSIFTGAAIGSSVATMLEETLEEDEQPFQSYKKKFGCDRCGFIPQHYYELGVHHINHNNDDNSIENLITICVNCRDTYPYADMASGNDSVSDDC